MHIRNQRWGFKEQDIGGTIIPNTHLVFFPKYDELILKKIENKKNLFEIKFFINDGRKMYS